MPKQAVFIFGPPGSGKGTQAELLARRFGFTHFDGGRVIENILHSPEAARDPVLRRQRRNFDTGKLCDPEWYLGFVKERSTRIANSGASIVYSGSLRTPFETFGDPSPFRGRKTGKKGKKGEGRTEGLLVTLARLYGKKNVRVVVLRIRPGASLRRNARRKVCAVCGLPQLPGAARPRCLLCGGPMRVRSLDKPAVIRERLREYRARTLPLLARIKRQGFRVVVVNGELAPYRVFEAVARAVGLKLRKTR